MAEEVIVINEPNEIAKDSLTRYYEKGVLQRLGIDWKPEKQRMRAKLAALGRFHAPDGKFISKQILNA